MNTIAITPKSGDKCVVKVFIWSEVYLSEMTCYKIHTLEACSKLGLVLSHVQKPAENFVPPICPCRQMALRSHKRPLENTRPAMGPVGPALAKPAFFARSAGPARLVRAGARRCLQWASRHQD